MGKSISTIQRSPRINTSYKFAAFCNRLPPMALQKVQLQVSVEPRLSTVLKDRSVVPYIVVPKTKSLPVSATTFPTALSFLHRAGTIAKGYPTANQAVLKCRTVAIPKGNNPQVALFFLLEACQRSAAGSSTVDLRQADQRTQSFPFPIVIHQPLDPAGRALKRRPCLYMHSSTRQAQNASTLRVHAPSR